MAGVITTGNHPKALWPGVWAWFGRFYTALPEQWRDLFDVEGASKQAFEELAMATGFGLAPVKEQGKGVYYDSEQQGYVARFTHTVYGIGYIVTREEMEDNLYEYVSKRRAQSVAFSMKQTQEYVHANIYNYGFTNSTPHLGGDGVCLFSSSHPSTSGNQSNVLSVAADLSETAIEDMVTLIRTATNDRGLKAGLQAVSLHVPPALDWDAGRILKSVLQNDTAQNAINVLRATNSIPQGHKVNLYFTDPDAWYVRTNAPYGMLHFDKRKYEFVQDNDFDTENAKAKGTVRFSCGWADWRGAWGSPGA